MEVSQQSLLSNTHSRLPSQLQPQPSTKSRKDTIANMPSATRKKFRKMRAVFEEKMRLSDKYCMDEEHAGETAKRLAIEIE